jgi:hypothetical protein
VDFRWGKVGWNLFGCEFCWELNVIVVEWLFFVGVSRILRGFDVVNLWCSCGDLRGGCGVLAVMFRPPKNTPLF